MVAQSAVTAVSSDLLERCFSEGLVCQVIEGSAPLRIYPHSYGELDTVLHFGRCVRVLSVEDGWVRVRADFDGKEGYVEPIHLSTTIIEPTHRVCVPAVFTTMERPVQSPKLLELRMNALVTVIETPDKFSRIHDGGWINHACLMPVEEFEEDPVEVASRFLRAPYDWGSATLDCSALIQTALVACGMADVPRDSGPQRSLGEPVALKGPYRRGDLLCWGGHVGMMWSDSEILHATDDTMRVIIEPVADVIARRLAEEPEDKRHLLAVRRIRAFVQP